ncbi:pyridoxine/pyridoxamine 5'-phosphate oxidase [Kordia sp. SMS9]|uniref:pyridoxine/pyridoxamine 5'-phosphate oxidase n=1 Tax=Kordia sp. SMS9 TaxID=2282170 RepID=UPI000E0D45A8|nr:pyridoxal 5'-phosphate synthase [Kordia sp. SMS9]AXG71392.1 pyridoxine/pyridoxamine 5'-phosphate oxidase [Kordia sp. SMS9]
MNPFQKFTTWLTEECKSHNLRFPAACCFSTIGVDGYPNARFVSLKEVTDDGFIITGTLSSQKGVEITQKPTAALTFWWTATERQVRIQGDLVEISETQAERYFSQRNRDSQLVSTVFNQGEKIVSFDMMKAQFKQQKEALQDASIEKPENWSGICILPKRIEFMDFKVSRLHERTIFEKQHERWEIYCIQP